MVQINANVNLINAICVYPEFTHLSTSTFLSRNRQGNVNSFCIVQFSRSFSQLCLSDLSDDFVIISHLFEFVKRFFKLFSKFFSNHLGSFKRSDFLFESFYIISHCLSFVKRFSKLFSKFFVTFSLSLCPHLECLSIISPSPAKVNTFLKSFFHSLLMSYIFNSFSTIHSNMHCCTHFFTLFYLLYSRFFTNN